MEPDQIKLRDQAVDEALQKRDLNDLQKEIKEGFSETHRLQSITNGKVLRAEADIVDLKNWRLERKVERKYEKLIWYCLTATITIIVGLGMYIIQHRIPPQTTTITIPSSLSK